MREQTNRTEYTYGSLSGKQLAENPFTQFSNWFHEASEAKADDMGAMCLSTVSETGIPDSRIVLMKEFNEEGITFYTNYNSKKGIDIHFNPNVAVVFYWPRIQRQVRITGIAKKISTAKSDAYFSSRPQASKVGAIASPQSKPLKNRLELEKIVSLTDVKYKGVNPERPLYWGGYLVSPTRFEFWQGRENRLNDRFEYYQDKNQWIIQRLAP